MEISMWCRLFDTTRRILMFALDLFASMEKNKSDKIPASLSWKWSSEVMCHDAAQ